ncbi:hypothetical protein ACOMHN_029066 [Nucella lapillus]
MMMMMMMMMMKKNQTDGLTACTIRHGPVLTNDRRDQLAMSVGFFPFISDTTKCRVHVDVSRETMTDVTLTTSQLNTYFCSHVMRDDNEPTEHRFVQHVMRDDNEPTEHRLLQSGHA